ncbi:Lipase 1 [Colletotrichum sp. SAR 10_77]|nr:Lipase 1 [Colletotrichum sp. SAR 10_77]
MLSSSTLISITMFLTPDWLQKYMPPSSQVIISPSHSESTCSSFKSYTALGDSYAAGFGSHRRLQLCDGSSLSGFGSTCTTSECGQDTGSYAWLFAHSHGTQSFQNLACSGLDTKDTLSRQVNSASFGSPDLVTVSMGGDNNSLFHNVILSCIFWYVSKNCDRAMADANSTIQSLSGSYDEVFDGIKAKVRPGTKVVALGYAQFWGSLDVKGCESPLNFATKAQKATMNVLAMDINGKLKEAASRAGYLYADVDAAYQGHRVCDVGGRDTFNSSLFQLTPKVGNDTAGRLYSEVSLAHPTALGQEVMLRALNETLGC